MVHFHTKRQRNVGVLVRLRSWGHWHWGLMWSGDAPQIPHLVFMATHIESVSIFFWEAYLGNVSCWRVKCGGRLDSLRGLEMEGGPWKQNSIQNPWTHIGWECMLVSTLCILIQSFKPLSMEWMQKNLCYQSVCSCTNHISEVVIGKKSFVALSLPENDCIGHTIIHKKTKFYVFKINECFV